MILIGYVCFNAPIHVQGAAVSRKSDMEPFQWESRNVEISWIISELDNTPERHIESSLRSVHYHLTPKIKHFMTHNHADQFLFGFLRIFTKSGLSLLQVQDCTLERSFVFLCNFSLLGSNDC